MNVSYDPYETPNLAKDGEKQPLHAHIVLKSSCTVEGLVEQVTTPQHMPHAQVVDVIKAISKELQHLLSKGFSVELGDIDCFTLSLSVNKKVLEPKDLHSPSIPLKDTNSRVNRQFKKEIGSRTELQRYHSSFRVKNPLGGEECLQRLNILFEDHSRINRQNYAQFVGKTKKQALQGINAFIEKGILKKYGAGRSAVYIKVG